LERDDKGNYLVFKPGKLDDADGAEADDEDLNDKFLGLKSTRQIQILLVSLKTQIYHAQEQEVKVGYMKKQYAEIAQKLA
jgi:hypothetical protein